MTSLGLSGEGYQTCTCPYFGFSIMFITVLLIFCFWFGRLFGFSDLGWGIGCGGGRDFLPWFECCEATRHSPLLLRESTLQNWLQVNGDFVRVPYQEPSISIPSNHQPNIAQKHTGLRYSTYDS